MTIDELKTKLADNPLAKLRRSLEKHDGTAPHPRAVPLMFHGLKVLVENPAGSLRRGAGKGGKWETRMKAHYGRLPHSTGIDHESVDVYVGPDRTSRNVYIVNQNHPDTGIFDEQKVVLGSPSMEAAKALYLAHVPSPKFMRSVTEMPFATFASMVNRAGPGGIRWTRKLKRDRRDADRAIFSANFESEDDKAGHWITIGAQHYIDVESGKEEHSGGSPVFIKDGVITKGAPSLVGWKPSELSSKERKSGDKPSPRKEESHDRAQGHDAGGDRDASRPEPVAGPGGTGGGDRPEPHGGGKAKISTIRAHLTPTADESLIPAELHQHLAPHQKQATAAMISAMDKHGGGLLMSGTGAGKTRTNLAVAKRYAEQGGKVLIVAPKAVIRSDFKKGTFSGSYKDDAGTMGIPLELIDENGALEPGKIKITTYDRFKKLKQPIDDNTTLIYDECFPFDTLVLTDQGWMKIGELVRNRLKIRVLSCNLSSNALEWKPVVRWVINPLISGLLRVKHEHGYFDCTPHHKVWTRECGYVRAERLSDRHHLRMVQGSGEEAMVEQTEAEVLHNRMRGIMEDEPSSGHRRTNQKDEGGRDNLEDWSARSSIFVQDEVQKPDAVEVGSGQGFSIAVGATYVVRPRRQRQAIADSASPASGGYGTSNGIRGVDEEYSESEGAENTKLVQAGFGVPRKEDWNRSGRAWAQSDCQARAGSKEGNGSRLSRVEGVEVLQSPDHGRYRFGGEHNQIVYNLEVEGNHNYFARPSMKEGAILVSNSHAGKNYDSAISKRMAEAGDAAKNVLYATATPADKAMHVGAYARSGVFGNRHPFETFKELGMKREDQHIGGGRYAKVWKRDVGPEEMERRINGLFDQMTREGLAIKHEVSLDNVKIENQTVPMPPEAQEMMRAIAAHYPSKQRAQSLMAQRLQQEPFKIPTVVQGVKDDLAAGRRPIIFAGRVNASKVGGDDGDADEEDKDAIAQSEGTVKALKAALAEAGITDVSEIHGGVSDKAREKGAQDFQSGKNRVLIGTVESAGTGINLDDTVGDAPRTLTSMTAPFSANSLIQQQGRANRLTTKSPLIVRNLYGDTEIDDWNRAIVEDKLKTLGAAVGGDVRKLSADYKPDKEPEPYKWRQLTGEAPVSEIEPKRVETKKGTRFVHALKSTPELERMASGSNRPGWLSSNEYNGKRTVSVWGNTPDEVRERLSQVRSGKLPEPPPRPAPLPPAAAPPPQDELAKIAARVTPEHKAAIHEALRHLHGQNQDQASEINGVGFNKMDSGFGGQLAESPQLTDRQAAAAAKMLHKYKKQIGEQNHAKVADVLNVPPEPKVEQKPAPAQSKIIRAAGKTFDNKDTLKRMGFRWNPDERVWYRNRDGFNESSLPRGVTVFCADDETVWVREPMSLDFLKYLIRRSA